MNSTQSNFSEPGSIHSPIVGKHVENHDFDFAFAEADRLVQEAESDLIRSYHLNTRGFLHLQLGRYNEALADCGKARSSNPNLDQNNFMMAKLFHYHFNSDIVPAMEQLKEGHSKDAFYRIGLAYHEHGFYPYAVTYFHLALKAADSEDAEIYNMLGDAYLRSGLVIEALEASARAVQLDTSQNSTNLKLAAWHLRKNGLEPEDFLKEGIGVDIHEIPEGKEEEYMYYISDDNHALLDHLNDVIGNLNGGSENDLGDTDQNLILSGYINHRALTHMDLGNMDEAIEDSLKARSLNPHLDHTNLRLAQFFKEHYDEKLKPLFKSLSVESSAEIYNEIAQVFFDNEFYAHSAFYFRLAADMAEDVLKAQCLNNLSGAYYNAGHYVDALYASEEAVYQSPEISKANYNLSHSKLKLSGFIQLFNN